MTSLMIARLSALEVLDSRGRPTLEVGVTLYDGSHAKAGVPSGASTGSREAVELRDGDSNRFGGLGVSKAVDNVLGPIAEAVVGRRFADLGELDAAVRAADGTPDKSHFGANAIVGVSMASARALANSHGLALWETLDPHEPRLPVPHFNVVNGGVHAANSLDFQEFMLAPLGAANLAEAIRAGAEVYTQLRKLLASRGLATGLGDEGGFAPEVSHPEEVLSLLVQAITDAGYTPGREGIAIALDPASSEFYRDGAYHVAGQQLSSSDLIAYYGQLVADFPIWSIEDGLAEDDWDGWRAMNDAMGERIQIVGDDIFVTDPKTIADAEGVANAALIKVNQIGTISQTLEALDVCRRVGFAAMISHRSGETPDPFIADLAVASGFGQLKSGAPARGERVAKYNRLLQIAAENPTMPFGLPDPA
jgi:enolase